MNIASYELYEDSIYNTFVSADVPLRKWAEILSDTCIERVKAA